MGDDIAVNAAADDRFPSSTFSSIRAPALTVNVPFTVNCPAKVWIKCCGFRLATKTARRRQLPIGNCLLDVFDVGCQHVAEGANCGSLQP